MEIILFGQLADIAGSSTLQCEALADTDMLTSLLEKRFPTLTNVKYMIAINRQVIQQNTPLTGGETIALMPPFSGG